MVGIDRFPAMDQIEIFNNLLYFKQLTLFWRASFLQVDVKTSTWNV